MNKIIFFGLIFLKGDFLCMYVVNRKRISLILICLLLGIFAYSYQGAKIDLDEEIQETTSTPVSGKIIVVDD